MHNMFYNEFLQNLFFKKVNYSSIYLRVSSDDFDFLTRKKYPFQVFSKKSISRKSQRKTSIMKIFANNDSPNINKDIEN